MKTTWVHYAAALVLCAVASPIHALAQSRTAITVGGTLLDFELGNSGAVFGELRTQQSALELAGIVILPFGRATAIPECLPGVLCLEQSTPSALVAGLVSFPLRVGVPGLRMSPGLGGVRASGMKGLERRSSIAGSLAMDWTFQRSSGLTPTLGVRAVGLTGRIGGMRYVILPSIGIVF